MSLLGSATASVGLQLLLQPWGNGNVGLTACTCVGLIYPAYRTLQTVEAQASSSSNGNGSGNSSAADANKWLTYWSVYGLLTALERPLDRAVQWVPYYHPIKLLFLVWLQHGDYEGARRVYAELLRPLLAAWRPSLDDFLGALLRSLRRPELQLLGGTLHHFASRTPVLEWFVRGPDGRPRPPPSSLPPPFITDITDSSADGGPR